MTAADRARELLTRTADFEELGLHALAATARAVARDVLELTDALDAERAARRAIQERHEGALDIIRRQGAESDQLRLQLAELQGDSGT